MLLASHETTSSRTFPLWLVGVLPGSRSPFPGCWLISQQNSAGLRKYNPGGETAGVRGCVCVGMEPQGGAWLLLPATTLQCVIPQNPATAAQSPWARWPLCLIPSFWLKGWVLAPRKWARKFGTLHDVQASVGKKTRVTDKLAICALVSFSLSNEKVKPVKGTGF